MKSKAISFQLKRDKKEDKERKESYQAAPQNIKTASHNHPNPKLPATTLPTPPVAVTNPEFVL